MATNSDFSNFLTKKLSTLALNKLKQSGSLTFGSLTQAKKYTSVFENSTNDISKIDFESVSKALNSGTLSGITDAQTKGVASVFNELMAIDEIRELADVSGDGKLDAKELKAFAEGISGSDGNAKTISMEDVNALLDEMGVDLDTVAEEAIQEAIDNLEELEKEEAEKAEKEEETDEAEETKAADKTKEAAGAQQSSSPSSSSPAGGSSGSGNVGNTSGLSKAKNSSDVQAETPEQIQAKIDDKNSEISDVESEAEAKIKEEEALKEKEMKQAGVSEKEYEEYQKKDAELDKKIKDTEQDISDKDDEIADNQSTIDSNVNYIGDIDSQIQNNEARKASITGDDADTKKSAIDVQINNLKNKKSDLENENKKLEDKIKKAESDKQKLEADKAKYEKEKQELLSKTLENSKDFGKGIQDSKAVTALKDNIMAHDTKIKEIRAEKNSRVNELKGEIQTLQVDLKDAKAREERAKFVKENAATNGFGLSGEELAEIAKTAGGARGTHGWCLAGVNDTLEAAYGIRIAEPSAYLAVGHMDEYVAQGKFDDITSQFSSYEDLRDNAPAGAIIVWDNNSSNPHGHICVAMGDGQGEISDHASSYIYNIGTKYHVYYPT